MKLKSEKKSLSIWLAKLPKYLGEKILQLDKGALIGTLRIDSPPNSTTPPLDFRLSPAMCKTGIPIQHHIEAKEKDKGMYIISNINSNFAIEGVVSKEVFIRPAITPEYLEFKRSIKIEETEKVKVIDYFSEVKRSAKYSALREMDVLARRRKEMLQEKKRERLDKAHVLEIVFNAFERHETWTVKDLADFSGQPVAYIQEIVNEICVLNKRDHRNTYELKPEYRYH